MKRLVFAFAILGLLATVGCGVGGSANGGTLRSFMGTGTAARIAFLSDRDALGLYQLYYMNYDGTEPTRVPLDASFDGQVWDPEMSPDGTTIVFARSGEASTDVYSASLDANTVVQLTSGADSYAPHFSPDGTKIVFIRNDGTGIPHVWTMNADGSGQTDITAGSTHRYSSANYANDGSSIIAVRVNDPNASSAGRSGMRPSVASGGMGNEIVSLSLDGTTATVLESVSDNNSGVQYSSDGLSLIYSVNGGYSSVISDSLSDHSRTTLTPTDSNNENPRVWGGYIFYVSQRDGNLAIYRLNADGSNEVRLTDPAQNNCLGAVRH